LGVRIPRRPQCSFYLVFAGVTQLARVTAFQAVGRGFESRLPLKEFFTDDILLIEPKFLIQAQLVENGFLINSISTEI
jgi:hypothetical protein